MTQQMVLNRKTKEVKEFMPELGQPTRKELKESFLPKVGDKFGEYKVIYVNVGQFRFSATAASVPSVGTMMENDGKVYQVERIDVRKGKFNAVFKGFKQNPVAPAPLEIDEDLAKVI